MTKEGNYVISKFLQMQMDYIFFFYGLGFILLAAASRALSRTEKQQMPWKWLCLFGLVHGISEWLDMLVFSLKDSSAFSVVRLIVLALSFLFLIEFGRAGSKAVRGKGPGRWVFIPLLSLAGLGAFAGMSGLNAAVRYALGFTGGLWTAAAVWQHRHAAHPGSRPLLIAALSMGIYGLAAGVVVPQAQFFPAAFLNQASFFGFTGFPIQLLRGILACMMAAAVWQYYGAWRRTAFRGVISPAAFHYEGWTIAAIATVLATGWIMTCSFGEFGQQRDEGQYNSDLKLVQRLFEASVETADQLVQTMAASPNLITIGLPSRRDLATINSTLDSYARVIPDSICYVLDSSGTTLVSSNRDTPSSFVGHSYAIRPYFKKAMKGLQGSYVAVGLTSNEPGYYSSYPVRDAGGEIAGVAVLKLNLDKLLSLPIQENYGFLVDPNGIILSSTPPGFVLNPLRPIGEEVRRELTQSEQYPALTESPVLPAQSVPGTLFIFRGEYLQSFQQTTSVEGLTLVILGSMSSCKMARLVGILITLLVAVLLVVFFVTQQRNSESSARIAASERLYRTLVEGSPNWVGLFDHDGRCVAINQNGLRAMGLTDRDVHGKGFNEIWSKETGPRSQDPVSRVLRGEQVSFEGDHIRPDGSSTTWHTILNAICELDGTVSAFVGIATDITERKRAEDALKESEERYRAIFENTGTATVILDEDTTISLANTEFVNLTGYTREEIEGKKSWKEFVVKEDLESMIMQHRLRRVDAGTAQRNYDFHLVDKDGRIKDIHLTIDMIPATNKSVASLLDITERKRAEEALRKSEERLRLTLEVTNDGIWDWYIVTGEVVFSPRCYTMLGYEPYEFPQNYNSWRSLVHPEDIDRAEEEIKQHIASGEGYAIEIRMLTESGDWRWILTRGRVVEWDTDGRPCRMVGTHSDITERVQQEREIKLLNRLYSVLSQVSQAVVRATSPEAFLEEACRVIVREGEFLLSWIGYVEVATNRVVPTAISGQAGDYALGITVYADDRPEGRGPTGSCIRERRPFVYNEFLHDRLAKPWRQGAARFGIKAAAAFPIEAGGQVWGALTIYSDEIGFFGDKDVRLLEKVAGDIGFALDNLEKERKRRQGEEALRDSQERLSLAMESARAGTWDRDIVADKSTWDDYAHVLFGLTPGTFSGKQEDFLTLLHPVDRERVRDEMNAAINGDAEYSTTYRVIWPDSSVRFIAGRGKVYHDNTGRPVRMIGVNLDITELKQSEVALKESEKQLRFLSSRLLEEQEEERKRIARELHDSIGQSLAAIKFNVENISEEIDKDLNPKIVNSLEHIITVIRNSMEEARRIYTGLRPSMLDDLGIIATIGWFCREFQKTYESICIEQQMEIEEAEIPESLKIVIFRIVQEALNNIAKHSGAELVNLCLERKDSRVELVIEDNGTGFDVDSALVKGSQEKGLGITGMKERTEFSSGTFSIESVIGEGTTIHAAWPMQHHF